MSILLIFNMCIKLTWGFYGFDCTTTLPNLTTISLVDMGNCDLKAPDLNVTKKHVQLIQLNDFSLTKVQICAIKVTRIITDCGNIASYASRVHNGEVTYYKEITREECASLQARGEYEIGQTKIINISRNGTTQRPIKFAGTSNEKGNCKGASYSDNWGTYEDVLVQGYVEIVLKDYFAEVHIESNKIKLRSGLSCSLTDSFCIDYDGSYAYWEMLPPDMCGLNKYSVLFQGRVNVTCEKDENKMLYSIESEDFTFALWRTGTLMVCGYQLIRTEHPKLFFLENPIEKEVMFQKGIATANLDIFAYIDSKFVYVEKHLKRQINNMYYDIVKRECEIERKVLINALSIATINPESFGFLIMGGPGYLGILAGETINLIKCEKVELEIRPTKDKCYEQLPVYRGKEEFFLSPRTRILLKRGTIIDCSQKLTPMYKLNNVWIKLTNLGSITKIPEVLSPNQKPTWKYNKPGSLTMSGIYSRKDIDRLRNFIMMSAEKNSIINNVMKGFTEGRVSDPNLSIKGFIDEKTLDSLAEKAWNSMWSKFMNFGTVSAGIIGIFMIIKLFKLIVDTIIRGKALFLVYGTSISLLGALFNSVTQLLLYLAQRKEKREEEKKEKETGSEEEETK